MKKLILALSLIMLLPLQAMALQTLNDNDMGAITGQSGVSIAVDDVKIYQRIAYLTYTDSDGTGTVAVPGTSGSVNIQNLYMMVNINAITHLTAGLPVSPGRAVLGTYYLTDLGGGAINYNNNAIDTTFTAKPITIDVGDMAVLSEGLSYNNGLPGVGLSVAGVRIGLPTAEIHQTALAFDVTITGGTASPPANPSAAVNSGYSYGRISLGANTMTVLDGFVEIAPH